jgi:uncharacterized protein (DUF305 family)
LRCDHRFVYIQANTFFLRSNEAFATFPQLHLNTQTGLNVDKSFDVAGRKSPVACPVEGFAAIFLPLCIMVGGALSYQVFRTIRSVSVVVVLFSAAAWSQQAALAPPPAPAIVQPGAPGSGNKTLSRDAATASEAPKPPSKADIDFMQGMIMHHNQAVEMTELLKTRTKEPAIMELGKKIDVSQTDEMRWMKQWLTDRGFPISADPMAGMDMKGMDMSMPMMPGMLTPAQMDALRKASGPEFDHLFLTGMIQHHTGALQMVKDLFANLGAGQDPQLFDFASDVDNTQQAEIDIMRHILKEKQ